jgi:hypothetical protein
VKALALVALLGACQSSDVSRELGAECTSSKDCDAVCATGAAWPDGLCTTSCTADADCPSEAACVPDQGGICAFRCTTDETCAFLGTGYRCTTMDMVCRGD